MKLIISALFFVITAISNRVSAADVQVNVFGIDNTEGVIRVALFPENKKEGFPVPMDVEEQVVEADIKGISVIFANLDPGTYAISVLHDKNNNDEMDTFFGIPSEPYGNSGAYTRFKPDYDDSRFDLEDENIIIRIEVH